MKRWLADRLWTLAVLLVQWSASLTGPRAGIGPAPGGGTYHYVISYHKRKT